MENTIRDEVVNDPEVGGLFVVAILLSLPIAVRRRVFDALLAIGEL